MNIKDNSQKDFDEIINDALAFIVDRFRCVNSRCGWHQHLDNLNKVGNAATAQGLIILSKFRTFLSNSKEIQDIAEKSVKTLINNQNNDGGWSYETNVTDLSATEPTSWCILGLIDSLYFDFPMGLKNDYMKNTSYK